MRYAVVFLVFIATLYGGWQSAFLSPEDAFKAKAELQDDAQIKVTIELGKDIYLYEEQIKIVDPLTDDAIVFQNVKMDEAVLSHEEMVFLEDFHATIDLAKEKEIDGSREIKLEVSFHI